MLGPFLHERGRSGKIDILGSNFRFSSQLHEYVLSTYYVPGTALDPQKILVETNPASAFRELLFHIPLGGTDGRPHGVAAGNQTSG